MTTNPMPPVVPPDDSDRSNETDSADADREAAYGKQPPEGEETGKAEETSADADYDASMGERPETD